MTPAPATGRTADENEMMDGLPEALRAELMPDAENLAVALTEAVLADGLGFKGPFEESGRIAEPLLLDALGAARRDGAQIANAQLQADLMAERNDGIERFAAVVVGRAEQRIRADAAEANLIALAKMYGEACWKMVHALACVQDLSANNVALGQEAATLRARLQEAERALEASGRVPSEPGYSGFAPSPMVSASGEYPSRGQAGMIKRLTKAYRRNDWPTMSDGGKIFALNRMTDALRKVGFCLVALGIEAECQDAQRLDALHESPTPQGGMPEPLATLVPQTQEAGDHEPR